MDSKIGITSDMRGLAEAHGVGEQSKRAARLLRAAEAVFRVDSPPDRRASYERGEAVVSALRGGLHPFHPQSLR